MHPPGTSVPPAARRGAAGAGPDGAALATIGLLVTGYVTVQMRLLFGPLRGPGLAAALALGLVAGIAACILAVRLGRLAAAAIRSVAARVDATRGGDRADESRPRGAGATSRTGSAASTAAAGTSASTASATGATAAACED